MYVQSTQNIYELSVWEGKTKLMHTLIFNWCFKLTRNVYGEIRWNKVSNHLSFLLLRSDCGGSITFPTAWIVGKERPQSRLYLDRGYKMCFAHSRQTCEQTLKIFWLEVHGTCERNPFFLFFLLLSSFLFVGGRINFFVYKFLSFTRLSAEFIEYARFQRKLFLE